jgi:hypothetical protein
MGQGNGTFGAPDLYDVTGWAWQVAVGEFNEDGRQDLAYVGNHGLHGAIRLGNGDGTFGPEILFGVGGDAHSVAVADFDGDGRDDLAHAPTGVVDVLLGNGDGTFASAGSFAAGDGPRWLAAGDFDNDDAVDLAVTNDESQDLSLLLGNGDGTFAPEQRHGVLAGGSDPYYSFVSAADLDRDGLQDLVVGNGGQLETVPVAVLFGTGGGAFAPAVIGDVHRPRPLAFAVADFDGDGAHDVARPGGAQDDMVWLLGKGDGTFATSPAPDGVGDDPTDVLAGDVNGDGRLDLVVGNGSSGDISTLLADGAATFAPEVRSCALALLAPCPWTQDLALALGDLTGDAHPDLIAANYGPDSLSLLEGNGTGAFAFVSEPIQAPGASPSAVALGDLNGDELLDVIATTWGTARLWVLLADGSGGFVHGPQTIIGEHAEELATGHFDGDAFLDVAVLFDDEVPILLGTGDGSFVSGAPLPGTLGGNYNLGDVAAGELNGDGHEDLVVAQPGGDAAGVFLGNGDGTFIPASTVSVVAPFGPWSILIEDLDGDERADPALTVGNSVSIHVGNGDGTFGPGQGHMGGFPDAVAGDFDLDGRLDLVSRPEPLDALMVLLNQLGPTRLRFLADDTTFEWPATLGAQTYDVYRGEMAVLLDEDHNGLPDAGYGVCLTELDDDARNTHFVDPELPEVEGGFFYLTSPVGAPDGGGLGTTSAGLARVPQVPCP